MTPGHPVTSGAREEKYFVENWCVNKSKVQSGMDNFCLLSPGWSDLQKKESDL